MFPMILKGSNIKRVVNIVRAKPNSMMRLSTRKVLYPMRSKFKNLLQQSSTYPTRQSSMGQQPTTPSTVLKRLPPKFYLNMCISRRRFHSKGRLYTRLNTSRTRLKQQGPKARNWSVMNPTRLSSKAKAAINKSSSINSVLSTSWDGKTVNLPCKCVAKLPSPLLSG